MDINSSYANSNATRYESQPVRSIQAWKTKNKNNFATAQDQIENNLNRAAHGQIGTYNTESIDNAYSLRAQTHNTYTSNPYEFKDVLDIVNPLHHIPIVGTIYRSITGDELKPTSRIIGGSIFGGPIGAVTSTVHTISEMQTGRDLNDRALNMIGFAGAPKAINPEMLYRRYQETDELRTVNWDQSILNKQIEPQEPSYYEPITEVELSPMPPRTLIDA